ncbi:hypothetical protein ACFSUC_09155 [Marinicrinis sediminis]|uniref:Lactococcin 972 family bacteriocin n=1 Tax=Marinicrinis sediminis TaxID=1652465 RepID=A0ABW5RA30_9BACL
MRRTVFAMFLSMVIFGIVSASVMGGEGKITGSSGISGGWSEEMGYYTNESVDGIVTMASNSPDNHKATKKYREAGSNLETNLIGETWWSDEYHYTRARFEYVWPLSGNFADTGRIWGWDYTRAETEYVIADFSVAHTYWGN